MRPDPHAGKVPGQGCPCALCAQPLPTVDQLNPIESQAKRDLYESGRRLWYEAHPERSKQA